MKSNITERETLFEIKQNEDVTRSLVVGISPGAGVSPGGIHKTYVIERNEEWMWGCSEDPMQAIEKFSYITTIINAQRR